MATDIRWRTECDAARVRWAKLSGKEIAEVIDHCGDGADAIAFMLRIARHRYLSDAFEVLSALHVRARVETAQELREFIGNEEPSRLDLFDKYARLAAEELRLNEAWIEGEADAAVNWTDVPFVSRSQARERIENYGERLEEFED